MRRSHILTTAQVTWLRGVAERQTQSPAALAAMLFQHYGVAIAPQAISYYLRRWDIKPTCPHCHAAI